MLMVINHSGSPEELLKLIIIVKKANHLSLWMDLYPTVLVESFVGRLSIHSGSQSDAEMLKM